MTQTAMEVLLNPSVADVDVPRLSRQCQRILDRLGAGPMTNVEAVTELRCLNFTARCSELKQAGYRITAARTNEPGVWVYRLEVRP